MSESEIDQLTRILHSDDWDALLEPRPFEGFTHVHSGAVETKRWNEVHRVITRGPSGQLYAWKWWPPLTENQEPLTPGELGTVPRKVREVTKTITVTEYIPE